MNLLIAASLFWISACGVTLAGEKQAQNTPSSTSNKNVQQWEASGRITEHLIDVTETSKQKYLSFNIPGFETSTATKYDRFSKIWPFQSFLYFDLGYDLFVLANKSTSECIAKCSVRIAKQLNNKILLSQTIEIDRNSEFRLEIGEVMERLVKAKVEDLILPHLDDTSSQGFKLIGSNEILFFDLFTADIDYHSDPSTLRVDTPLDFLVTFKRER